MTYLPNTIRRLLSPTMIGFIVTGYILLVGIVLFREEINVLCGHTGLAAMAEAAIAPVEAAPVVTMLEPTAIPENFAYQKYVQDILNNPANFQAAEEIPLGQAILEGKTTRFLVGF
ncbi:MAG: hypothetical protein PHR51_01330 [Patescibacteria group bacterium]|nr:hypothetical protein [Patescibacteria group bacterium]